MVSVITVTYNRLNFLEQAIRSVLNQTYTDFEYLIVDDGSTDGSEKVVKSFEDKRIKYIYSEHLGYISKLKNIALSQATGDIIAFLDSDDLWDQNYLKKAVQIFDKSSVNSVVANALILSEGNRVPLFKDGDSLLLEGNLLEQKLLNNKFLICTPCFSFRRGVAPIFYNETFKGGDSDLFLKILSLGGTVVLMDKLVTITKHMGSMSSEISYNSPFIQAYYEDLDTFKVLKQEGKISVYLYCKLSSSHLYKLANNLRQIKRREDARSHFLKAFIMFPLNVKALAKYFAALIR